MAASRVAKAMQDRPVRYRGGRHQPRVPEPWTFGRIYRVKSFIRNLPAPAEFCLVLIIGFGLGLIYEFWTIALRHPILISDRHVLPALGLDLLYLGIILWIGRIRGWSISSFGWRISWKGTAGGILLFIAATMVKILVSVLLAGSRSQRPGFTVAGLSVPVIILLAVINPFFEEVLEAGYFIHSLQRFGMWPAVLVSSIFRGLLHLYQGFDGAASIFTGGILFGLVYWRWRKLWPLIVAHSLDDLIGLLYLTHHAA
jgi:membrane protease YdiL (CAAX protease family)